jgi:hypothetical protein
MLPATRLDQAATLASAKRVMRATVSAVRRLTIANLLVIPGHLHATRRPPARRQALALTLALARRATEYVYSFFLLTLQLH